ncbi:unnamed protein product, partial [Mesorhabditis spiculigera]
MRTRRQARAEMGEPSESVKEPAESSLKNKQERNSDLEPAEFSDDDDDRGSDDPDGPSTSKGKRKRRSLSPKSREKELKRKRERMRALRARLLEGETPEDRKERWRLIHARWRAERWARMTPEERAEAKRKVQTRRQKEECRKKRAEWARTYKERFPDKHLELRQRQLERREAKKKLEAEAPEDQPPSVVVYACQ